MFKEEVYHITLQSNMSFDVRKFVQLSKKIVGAGLNYKSVIAERGLKTPTEPVIFLKATTSYITQGKEIKLPAGFIVHHEVELGAIIGKQCKNVEVCEVKDYIGGYCLGLDLTAVNVLQEARKSGNPWSLGKSFDTACPVSAAFTPEKVPEPEDVRVWLCVNGKKRQDMSTSDMIFSTDTLISYISKYITLEPYDLILTGSPSGIDEIKPGDTVTAGLGEIVQVEFKVAKNE